MKSELELIIVDAVQATFNLEVAIELTRPDVQFGDYATNVALQICKQLSQPPRVVAEQLAEVLRQSRPELIANVTVAGPGFINLTLTDSSLVKALSAKPNQALAGNVILAEYSDPNPFKPLHVGHLYTTLVGDVIAHLLTAAGAEVVRINYGGDVGMHVGKTMWSIIRELGGENLQGLQAVDAEQRAQWLGDRYVEGNTAYEDDEVAKQEIIATNKRVYQVHANNDHDSAFAQIYWTCREWSYEYFKVLYAQLDVHQFDRVIPESEIADLGLKIVREQLANGVYQESDGAVVFKGDNHGLHTRVFINSQDLPTYETKEVGLALTKWQDYHFDRSIIITANEQDQYMQVVYKSIEQFEPEIVSRSQHLTHGIVKLQGGVKMSSRKGNVIQALDILEAAAVANKAATGQDNQQTVLGAVKYAFLKNRIGGDIAYSPEESVSLEGNSGPYLQYAHARARSIVRKSTAIAELDATTSFEPDERLLLSKISEFTEVVDKAVTELMPHSICTYLYELAQTFNRFYEHNRVVDDPREAIRLSLLNEYAAKLKAGLDLLGIHAPEQM